MRLKILNISDTHCLHQQWEAFHIQDLTYSEYDLVIHSGDISMNGDPHSIENFLQWYHAFPVKNKVFILGNHEVMIQENVDWIRERIEKYYPSLTFLHHDSVTIEGFNIFGSPYTPYHKGLAFNVIPSDLEYYWDEIPNNTDILVTHGPPLGIADYVKGSQQHVGCKFLLNRVLEINPLLHQFGHIHEEYGVRTIQNYGDTVFVNASAIRYNPKLQSYVMNERLITTTLIKDDVFDN